MSSEEKGTKRVLEEEVKEDSTKEENKDVKESESVNVDDSSDEEGPLPVPKKTIKRRKLEHEDLYKQNLPSAYMYEKSYMHRDTITHVITSPITQFIITASVDGHVKFWKKVPVGIEFVKHYKSHKEAVTGLCCSMNGQYCLSHSSDKTLKIYDILTFDMICYIELLCIPQASCWTYQEGDFSYSYVVSSKEDNKIYYYRLNETEPTAIYTIHRSPVLCMAYNPKYNVVISIDSKGIIDYWNPKTGLFPADIVEFKLKTSTNLYDIARQKSSPVSITISPDGELFAVMASDSQIRIFNFKSGKLVHQYDESISTLEDQMSRGELGIEAIDFGRRLQREKDILSKEEPIYRNIIFDETGYFIFYGTLLGIKCINIYTNKCINILGKVENSERFTCLALTQGMAKVSSQIILETKQSSRKPGENQLKAKIDPTLFCTSYNKHRFYMFTKREPSGKSTEPRDIFNEKPTEKDRLVAEQQDTRYIASKAIMHTNKGDIELELFKDKTPKTYLFIIKEGYYNNLLFHRVIKDFMIQGGDPEGNGTGGESIWGGSFEDEFDPSLTFEQPFILAMANAGPNTNGSQFFITTKPCPHLNYKHTVFGRVTNGKDVVHAIENVQTHKTTDRPFDNIKIISIDTII
ncbi:hypothetical protein WA158_008297 [Blastocystis sp. Blastoise]